jgi:hypothetical protein
MTIRRGFNRLFIVAFICWNLANLWLIFSKAREAAASVYTVAEQERQLCVGFKKSGCPPKDPEAGLAKVGPGVFVPSGPTDNERLTCAVYWGFTHVEEMRRGTAVDLSTKDCQATFNQDITQHITWRVFKDQITAAKFLYIEGIPATVYVVCWVVAATFLWIARGFGVAGGEKRG